MIRNYEDEEGLYFLVIADNEVTRMLVSFEDKL